MIYPVPARTEIRPIRWQFIHMKHVTSNFRSGTRNYPGKKIPAPTQQFRQPKFVSNFKESAITTGHVKGDTSANLICILNSILEIETRHHDQSSEPVKPRRRPSVLVRVCQGIDTFLRPENGQGANPCSDAVSRSPPCVRTCRHTHAPQTTNPHVFSPLNARNCRCPTFFLHPPIFRRFKSAPNALHNPPFHKLKNR